MRPTDQPMTYIKLYILTVQISAMSFGGVYSIWALLQREIAVDCPAGQVPAQICSNDLKISLALSELIPGPAMNGVSLAAFPGFGVGGMCIILAALLTPGIILVPLLFFFSAKLRRLEFFRNFLHGCSKVSVPLLLLFFVNLAHPLILPLRIKSGLYAVQILVVFVLAWRYKIHPLLLIACGALVGYFLPG